MTQNASAPAPSPDLWREARRVASTLVVLSGTDCIGIGSYEPGIAAIAQLGPDGVKRRARTAEAWQEYIADALVKFAQQHAAAIASALTGDERDTGNSQDADANAAEVVHPVADAAAEAAKSAVEAAFASPADGMVCKNPMPSGRRACDAIPLDGCPCRSAEAANASATGNSQDAADAEAAAKAALSPAGGSDKPTEVNPHGT